MRIVLLLALLAAGCAHKPRPPLGPRVSIAPYIKEFLQDVQQHFELETVFCIGGSVDGDSLHIQWIKLAEHSFRLPTRVRYSGDCQEKDYLGIAHPHLGLNGCTFSEPDLETFRNSRRAVVDVVVGFRCMKLITRDGRETVIQ